MRSTVKLPKLADTADEVLVREWLVEVGDDVITGDPLRALGPTRSRSTFGLR